MIRKKLTNKIFNVLKTSFYLHYEENISLLDIQSNSTHFVHPSAYPSLILFDYKFRNHIDVTITNFRTFGSRMFMTIISFQWITTQPINDNQKFSV